MADSNLSLSHSVQSTEVVLQIDQQLALSALVEALQLLDGLLPLDLARQAVVAQVRVRLAYVLAHSKCPSNRFCELSQLANHHQALAQRVLYNLAQLPSLSRSSARGS